MDILSKAAKASEIKVLGKKPASLTIDQLKILIALLRCHKDKNMPTKKGDNIICLMEWEARGYFG